MIKNHDGLTHVLLLIVLVVLIVTGFVGWRVWDNIKNKDHAATIASGKTIIKGNRLKYENKTLGFSFTYPESQGKFVASPVEFGPETGIKSIVNSISSKNDFTSSGSIGQWDPIAVKETNIDKHFVLTGTYKPNIRYDLDQQKWIVDDTNDSTTLAGYKIGQEYTPSIASTVNGVPIYDITYDGIVNKKHCIRRAWIFERQTSFVEVILPYICAEDQGPIHDSTFLPYRDSAEQILSSFRFF